MRRAATYAFLAAGLAFTACGIPGLEAASDDESDYSSTTSGGYTGQGGGGGVNTNLGGSMSPGAFDYADLCGIGCEPGEACADEGAGGADGAGGGGGGSPGYGGAGPLACQLTLDDSSGEVAGACVPVGSGGEHAPCLDSSDCGPGLGCVDPGVCARYCCGSLAGCDESTFCAPRPMATGDLPPETVAPLIPVCVKVDDCVLLDDSTCPDGQTCTVVKPDGTVSCVTPGIGEAGDPCQCAPGHACKPEINTCFKLCQLDRPTDCPSDHTCQGGVSMYPEGFGICVEN